MKFPSRQPAVPGLPGVDWHRPGRPPDPSCCAGCGPATSPSSTTSTSTGPPPRRWSTAAWCAVVNASPFISGRYPNLGPELLARAGV